MTMDLDSQSMTPPSSPIIGYSGCDDEQTLIESGVVFCLNCKGAPRLNDFSFSPESYILRREVINAVDNLRDDNAYLGGEKPKPRLLKCFGHLFDPLDKNQIQKMILLCRKRITCLEVLSESSHSFNMLRNQDNSPTSDDLDDQSIWIMRKNVCQFLNVIVRGLKLYRAIWKSEEFQRMFIGLKKSLIPTQEWSSILKTHCGFRSGNECSSASYHFFHMQLELRWSLFLIFGATPSITDWLLDDLIHLAKCNFPSTDGSVSLHEKQPFNCMCVKEIWTMVRLVIEHKTPEARKENPFWTFYTAALQRCYGSDHFFQIWLTSYMAQISDHSISGVHRPGLGRSNSIEHGNNAYQFIHTLFKEWLNRGGRSAEVLKLSFSFFQYWGGDCDVLIALWTQWVPRLDQVNLNEAVSNMESYSNIEKWLKLIMQICEKSAKLCGNNSENDLDAVIRAGSSRRTSNSFESTYESSNHDPFLEFVFLVAAYSRWANEREIRKLKSNICMKLSRSTSNTNDYGENGIIRVTSLFLALAIVVEFEKEVVSLCERLQGLFTYGSGKNTPGRRKAILRSYSCMIIILLKRKISIKTCSSFANFYMKTVDELLCQVSTEASKRDIAMVYIDLLDSLPKHTPALCNSSDLARYKLISSNLSMWFTNAGHNYVIRTARCLNQMTEWIIKWIMDDSVLINPTTESEGRELFLIISEKSLPFMKSMVLLGSNRIPSTDMEPLACLAADITQLTKTFKPNSKDYETHFELFAMNEHTCPIVSQFFVQRLLKIGFFNQDTEISKVIIKWTQTWIRLVILDCFVPDELTAMVLANGFSSTCNQDLLREFCKKTTDKCSIQICLTPLSLLMKGVMSASLFKDEPRNQEVARVINSVISSCAIVMENVRFDYIYIKGNQNSLGHQLLDSIISSGWPLAPWEKFSPSIKMSLERNLYTIFKAIALQPGLAQDLFLCRKLQDIVAVSFFGFTGNPEDVDRNRHPAIKIVDLSEEKKISYVQNKILPDVIAGDQVIQDLKLCQLFLSIVHVFYKKQLAIALMRVLSGVIRAYSIHFSTKDKQVMMTCCINSVVYCCLVGSSNSQYHRELAVDAFKNAFEKEFLHRGRIILHLCLSVVKSKNSINGKLDARRFMKLEILPLLRTWVEKCEKSRGIGCDKSLREPLKKIEFETANVPL